MTAIDISAEAMITISVPDTKLESGLPNSPVKTQPVADVQETDFNTALLIDEGRLVAEAKLDPAAFQPLYERYVDQIYRYIYRRVNNHDEAEDLTAQTFQQALAALPSYEWRGVPFGSWLYRIAGNLVIRHRRVRGREVAVEYVERIVDERGSFDDPLEAILRQSSRDQLHEAMRRLNADQKRALVLKYSHGLKNHEVGALMNRSEGGIKQLVHRAMLVLRDTMAKDGANRVSSAQEQASDHAA